MKNPVDLSGLINPRLTFYTKYIIENNWDYGQVKISTDNGSTWNPLQGNYTNPGTGSFQPNGQPLYDGSRTEWVREEISLTPYSNNQVKIKFELKTDGSQQEDGWFVDDIGIMYLTSTAFEMTSFTALIEGLYDGSNMSPDTVTIEIRNASSPYSLVDKRKMLLDNSGNGSGVFSNVLNSTPYYIVLKHRSGLETWSATTETFINRELSFDFTTAQSKAYGNNLKQIGSKWCIYNGDVNKDGFINLQDVSSIFTDNINGLTGYNTSDLNGDSYTEIGDLNMVFINSIYGVQRSRPIDFPTKESR
jgi:hypothetical protein